MFDLADASMTKKSSFYAQKRNHNLPVKPIIHFFQHDIEQKIQLIQD